MFIYLASSHDYAWFLVLLRKLLDKMATYYLEFYKSKVLLNAQMSIDKTLKLDMLRVHNNANYANINDIFYYVFYISS